MEQILASRSVSITELKRSPSAVLAQAGSEAVAVLNHNRPAAYLLPPHVYEAMLERLSADLRHRFASGLTGSIQGRWSDIERMLVPLRETKFFTLEGRVRHPITPKFSVEAAALYRRERDSLNGNDEGVDFDFTLEWFLRQTEVRVKYKFGKFDDNFAQNDTSSLFVQVKRKF